MSARSRARSSREIEEEEEEHSVRSVHDLGGQGSGESESDSDVIKSKANRKTFEVSRVSSGIDVYDKKRNFIGTFADS